jgi:PPK2 family polyphosphate:nucleotide phosphotransferase
MTTTTKGKPLNDKRMSRIDQVVGSLRVKPGRKVTLPRDFDPAYKLKGLKKARGRQLLVEGHELLAEYQDRLAAQRTRGVLLILQAMDAAGKDGTIRHVMTGVNPQGVAVHGFKVPTDVERAHDFLWRYSTKLPQRGEICIFNRSYYEDVLVVRVHQELVAGHAVDLNGRPNAIWKQRFRAINDFERQLTENGFSVVKIFLNISKEEQRQRFLRRIDLPEKNWKFSVHDLAERQRWDDYQYAFGQMLTHTSTRHAPWYVVPADRKWFERIASAAVLVQTLARIDPQYPDVGEAKRRQLQATRAELLGRHPDDCPGKSVEAMTGNATTDGAARDHGAGVNPAPAAAELSSEGAAVGAGRR